MKTRPESMADEFFKLDLLKTPSKQQRLSLLRFYNRNFPKSKWNEEPLKKYFSDRKRRPLCIIIRNKDKITGLIMGRLSSADSPRLNLAVLLVSRRYRGRGWGKILMRELFKSAVKIPSLQKIYLHFRDSNGQLKSFYKRFGFGKHEICGKYTDGEKKHYMEISLLYANIPCNDCKADA